MTAPAPVAITGLGVVGPFGIGREAFLAGLVAGEPALAEVDRSAGFHRAGGARLAAPLRGEIAPLLPPGSGRRMSPPARYLVAAAKLALADAGLAADFDHSRTGIVSATSFGPAWVTEQLLAQILRQGPEATSPALFTESVANASAAQVALVLKARGPNATITQREASDVVALGEGLRWIRTGRADRVVVGVVEEIVPILHAVLDRFGALAHAEDGLPERPRPFDRRRNGLLLAEGAVALLLESERAAAERGARPLAVANAVFSAFDPSATAWDWGGGSAGLAAALRHGLGRAEVASGDVALVVSGASGSRRGDLLEGRTLRAVFGEALPPVAAPKGTTGEYGGGALAAAVLAAAGEPIGRGAGFEELDPEIGIRPLAGSAASPGPVLLSALAAGGAAAWAVFSRP